MGKITFKNLLYFTLFFVGFARFSSAEGKCFDTETGEKLQQIRHLMENLDIQAYIVPMADAHQSEYVSEADNRIKFITNFTGSAGEAVITRDKALFWTDSRYHKQADDQLELECWNVMKMGLSDVPSVPEWLSKNLSENNSRIGVDSLYISSATFTSYSRYLSLVGHQLIIIKDNLIDKIWKNKAIIRNEVIPLPLRFSGKDIRSKIALLRNKLSEQNADFIVIPTLDNIAWLLNLRGSDIPYNPVFFSYMILSKEEVYLFIEKDRITSIIENHFNSNNVTIQLREYNDIFDEIPRMVNKTVGIVLVESPVSEAITELIPNNRILIVETVNRIKSSKNEVEVKGMEQAHIRDGLALTRYLHWLEEAIDVENITEYTGAQKLTEFRSQNEFYMGLSFKVISAVGANAAMAHYTPTESTAKQITHNEIYLVDSGGQYLDGTTDVTRTMHFGTPTDFEMDCFTRVLKGFIALVTSVFPRTTPLRYLDYVARRPLWQVGLNYGHGTGHGVGSFLYVHEYPPLIHGSSDALVEVNMFTSDEPGFYLDDQFGIRIEDVIQVVESDIDNAFDGKGALTFKTITYAPLQTKMIKTSLLNKEEAKYVNDFNKKVIDTIGPILLKQNLTSTYKWLVDHTLPITATG